MSTEALAKAPRPTSTTNRGITAETLGERLSTLDKAQLILADAALQRRISWREVDYILGVLRYAAGHFITGYRLGRGST